MISKHLVKVKRANAGIRPAASEHGLWNTQKIVHEKYKAWLIRRGFKEEAP